MTIIFFKVKIRAGVSLILSLACLTCFGAQFDTGKYKIVVRIDDSVPIHLENSIVTHLKSFFTLTSSFINGATEKSTWFEEIIIVLPNSWNKTSLPSWTDVGKTDVIVTRNDRIKYPYTQQSQGCEHPGDAIYIPSRFLSRETDKYIAKRVLAKEWVQFQYGVFEEHGWENDVTYPKQYWLNGKLENTSCVHESIPTIMYDPKLSTTNEFCNEFTHNYETPNRQNILCNYRNVKEVIMAHPHLNNKSRTVLYTGSETPNFKIVKQGRIHIIIVIDASYQMEDIKIEFQQSIANFISHEIPEYSLVSIIEHKDGNAELIINATEITTDEIRENILDTISTDGNGSPSINSAVSIAKELNDIYYEYQTILLLPILRDSDGEDSLIDYNQTDIYLFYLTAVQPRPTLKTENIHYYILPTPNHLFTAFNAALNKFLQKYYPQTEKIITVTNELLVNKDRTFYVDSNVTYLIIVVMSSIVASVDEIAVVPPTNHPVLQTHSELCERDFARGINICKIPSPETGLWRISVVTNKLSQNIYLDIRVQCTSCVFVESWLSNYYITEQTPKVPLIYSKINSIGNITSAITDMYAEITHVKTRNQYTVQLFDDGRDLDIKARDQIFTSILPPVTNLGWYCVTIRKKELPNFQRMSSAGCFYVEYKGDSWSTQFQVPSRVLDLRIQWVDHQEHSIKLIWSLNNNASTFDIRWSTNRSTLQTNFDIAQKLIPENNNLTNLTREERAVYVTLHDLNPTLCYALKCINRGVAGSVSNIACLKHATSVRVLEHPIEWVNTAKVSSNKVFIIFSVATALSLLALFIVAVTICLLLTRYKLVRKRGKANLEEMKALSRKHPDVDDTDV